MDRNDKLLINKLKSLPTDFWDFKQEDVREYTHGIHNYPAMMVCPISRNIISIVKEIRKVDSLLDPFAGSGTVLVEGMLAGIKDIAGNDINPLASLLMKTKTTPLDIDELNRIVKLLYGRIDKSLKKYQDVLENIDEHMIKKYKLDLSSSKGWGDNAPLYINRYMKEKGYALKSPEFKNIGYWFRPRVIIELLLIKKEISKIDEIDIKDYIDIAFSETLRIVSNRRNGEFKMFRMEPEKVRTFNPAVFYEFKKILDRNIDKMNNFVNALSLNKSKSAVKLYNNNATKLNEVKNEKYDLIITSPPYGDSRTTVAYGEFSRLSLQWIDKFNLSDREIMDVDKTLMGGTKFNCGFDCKIKSKTLKKALNDISNIDSKRAGDVYSFYKDLDETIKSVSLKTKDEGYQFWVVGNRTVKNTILQTDKIIEEIAEQYNLEVIYSVSRNIINKAMPSLNSPTNETGKKSSTMTMEHIVILKKVS